MKKLLLKNIESESEYFDILFIAGIIMIVSGISLMILFNNKTHSITFLIVGFILSLIAKLKSRS